MFFKILSAAFLGLFSSCSPLGNPVDEAKSKNYYYDRAKKNILYCSNGNWFASPEVKIKADVASFKVIGTYFAKDDSAIYYENAKVINPKIDKNTFSTSQDYYMDNLGFDKYHVYLMKKETGNSEQVMAQIIPEADPNSFTKKETNWSKDKSHFYYDYQLIPVDYGSFKNLSTHFSKDKNRTYYHYKGIFKPFNADANSLSILDKNYYAYDKDSVYYLKYEDFNLSLMTFGYDPEKPLKLLGSDYLRIADKIYFKGRPLKGVDANSFEVITMNYAKDSEKCLLQE